MCSLNFGTSFTCLFNQHLLYRFTRTPVISETFRVLNVQSIEIRHKTATSRIKILFRWNYDIFKQSIKNYGFDIKSWFLIKMFVIEPRLVARALYNFVGQTARELTFRKGDLIYVRRQVDKNWYEGELNAMIGLFPTNYVEVRGYT